MKRSSLILACLFFMLNSSFAQPPFPAGTIGFGGGLGIHSEGGETTSGGSSFDKPANTEFSIDPKVLYGVSPKIQVGAEFSFAMEKVEDDYSQTMFGVNLLAENYCDKFSGEVGGIYSTGRVGFATGKWKDESGGNFEQDISKVKAGINYGAYLNLSPKVKLRTELGGLQWKQEILKDEGFEDKTSKLWFDINPIKRARVELLYYIAPRIVIGNER